MPSKNKENDIIGRQNGNTYIKKVILENFLSFQKDEVDFGEAKFVIIVGPNWSGKTSIFQAIKFALGSNERDDRYRKWSNFIRNGQNHAMVEIHIQNHDDLIQLRRYVIRGQSPFFKIKKNNEKEFHKIQAHDIQRVITDLKINPDNQFAFVSQGKVDAIKNLKPTELCSFLEEGFGLKPLRDEILNQKINVLTLDHDLKSLASRRNTLNVSLELLTPKLNRLEQKNKLLEVRKKYNDELLWANRDKLEKEIIKIEELIKNLKLVIDGIKKRKDKYDGEIAELIEKISIEEENINKLSQKLGELDYEKNDLIAKIQNWQKEKILAKQELDVMSKKIREIERNIINFEKQKESLEGDLKIIKREQKKLDVQIESLIKEQDQLVKKIKQNRVLLDEYNKISYEKQVTKSKIQANKKIIDSINDEINQLFQSFKDIEHKLEKNKWFLENPSKDLLQEIDRDLRKISLRIYEIDSENKKLEFEKSKKIGKLKILQTSLRERRVVLPSSISILKDEINRRDLKVKGPLIEYLKYDDDLSYAIESVLGEKLLYSFVAEDWDTLTLLKRLKDKYRAYCNIYLPKKLDIQSLREISANGVIDYLAELVKVVDDDLDIKKVIYSKVKNCLVVNDYHSGRNLYKKLGFKGKCVTLAGEQIISYKYVYETPYVKRLKGLLSAATQKEQSSLLESEIKSMNNSISELRVEQSKLDLIQKDLFDKKESFSDLLFNFNQKQRITTKKNQLYKQMHELEGSNSEFNDKLKDLDSRIRDLKSKTEPDFFKWNDRINEIPSELGTLNEEKKKWDLKLNENSEILKEVREELNKQKNELGISKLEYEKKKEAFQKADKNAFETYRQLENVENTLEKIEKEITDLKEKKYEFQNKKNEIDKRSIQITINLEQENIKLNAFNQEIDSKRSDFERINSEIGPLISEQIIEIRPIEFINEDISKIDKELLNYIDVDDSLIVEKDQIIASLKEINKNQKDLEKDIKAAIKTENKLEKTYYDKFRHLLVELQSKVNQKFDNSQIKSYCSLELIGKFENLGVEIKAATSKEQLKSFTALSGGQVSLISICLILSLQEIKPSPLCMFDEAGMFLDEKNSEVAYQLIKSTLEQNPIQLFMFLPKSSSSLFLLAEKIIGIARTGKNEISSVFKPKIIKKK
ncbi:MAG: AAA family ATPase [Candidatus Hodarchaeota archaeon]